MEQKIKFILIGLIGLSIIFAFLFIQTLNSKQQILRERNDLKEENASLSSKINKLQNSLRDYTNKINSINKELNNVSREKEELEKKYELVNKEKEELVERLQSQASRATAQAAVPQVESVPVSSDAYWAGILKAKTGLELQLADIRSELKSIQINNEQLQREKSTLELDIKNLRNEKEDLRRQLEYNQKLIDSISQELVREKNDKMQILENFKSMRSENVTLTRQLRTLNNRKINLEKKLQKLQEEKDALERRFNEMETMLTDKLSQITNLKQQLDAIHSGSKIDTTSEKKESVELPPIVVRPQMETSMQEPAATVTGKVLAVNKEGNFVIIDLGENDGIKAGRAFQIEREGAFIGEIEVIQTRRDFAACDIKSERVPIRVGDTVK